MVMAAEKEEERPLPEALPRVSRPRCLRAEEHDCPANLLTQTQQGHFAVTRQAGLQLPGSAWLSFCWLALPAGTQRGTPSLAPLCLLSLVP